jgi:uncharacterized RDD family membrane protein YckC
MTITADAFVARVLDALPPATPRRDQIAMELRGHIAERLESGLPLSDVLRQLGDPVGLAESYLASVPLVPGSLWRRIAARVIDLGLAALSVAPLFAAAWSMWPERMAPLFVLACVAWASLLVVIYPVVAEAWFGKTVGKHLMGLRVVRESGARISLGQSFVRQLPVLLQVIWVDALFALFTDRRQRAFELLSKTRVVSDPTRVGISAV